MFFLITFKLLSWFLIIYIGCRYINDATGAIYGILKEASQLHGNANKKKRTELKDEDAQLLQKVSDRVITKEILSEKLAQHVEQVNIRFIKVLVKYLFIKILIFVDNIRCTAVVGGL